MKALQAWKALSPRDRFLLKGLAAFLLGVLLFQGVWQPGRQRLVGAERYYQQQHVLAQQVQRAQPLQARQAATLPPASTIHDSAEAAGLEVNQIEVQSERLRLILSGEAVALLNWLAALERDTGGFHMLTLEKRDDRLEARLEL
ncbi:MULTISPECIES: type II secretion system protein GspM [Pseudomonas]|jgi:general secretion pathway protein M|uniref:General secretion pathway protein M n=1 Tax=Pseudomonas grimontii TaxID=129847 RepID=A0ABY0TCY2_9PSED|nr:type II secretion system protein GspM [Pseudomonas grimontii]MCS3512965.1 general secretion pathway protein M [Pseudomonas grimontii]SDQ63963.1 general secretion pathway protein M [Pseudomonas grimontii]